MQKVEQFRRYLPDKAQTDRQMDRQTDRVKDRQTPRFQYTPSNFAIGGAGGKKKKKVERGE